MCSIFGVGERLHKVLGLIDLGTLDSGERSLPFGLLVFRCAVVAPFNSHQKRLSYSNCKISFIAAVQYHLELYDKGQRDYTNTELQMRVRAEISRWLDGYVAAGGWERAAEGGE